MSNVQAEIPLSYKADGSPGPDRERQAFERIRRAVADAVDEIGRKEVCYQLELREAELSKKLSGAEERWPCMRILLFCLREQKSQRLARAAAEYSHFLPFQRPEPIDAAERLARLEAWLRANPSIARVAYDEAFGAEAPLPAVRAVRP